MAACVSADCAMASRPPACNNLTDHSNGLSDSIIWMSEFCNPATCYAVTSTQGAGVSHFINVISPVCYLHLAWLALIACPICKYITKSTVVLSMHARGCALLRLLFSNGLCPHVPSQFHARHLECDACMITFDAYMASLSAIACKYGQGIIKLNSRMRCQPEV